MRYRMALFLLCEKDSHGGRDIHEHKQQNNEQRKMNDKQTATKNLYNETTEQQTKQIGNKRTNTYIHTYNRVQYTHTQKTATEQHVYNYIIHTKKVPAETLASAGTPLSWRPPTLPLSQYHRRGEV